MIPHLNASISEVAISMGEHVTPSPTYHDGAQSAQTARPQFCHIEQLGIYAR